VADVLPISFEAPDQSAVFGFTAGTGGEAETGEVDNLKVTRIGCDDIQEVAVIAPPATPAYAGDEIVLDGSASNPGPGDTGTLAYQWAIVSGPASIVGQDDGPSVKVKLDATGSVTARLTVDDHDCANPASADAVLIVDPPPANWVRCELNGDGVRDISDPISLLSWLFSGGAAPECPSAGDCNSDGQPDISDAVFDLSAQFLGGPLPAAPYPACEQFPACGQRPVAGFCPRGVARP